MKKCTACGATFDDTSKFCPYCGMEHGAEERPAGNSEENRGQPEQPKKEKKIINNAQGMMLWHKIVLFLVGIRAVRCLIRGLSILRGYVDSDVPESMVPVRNLFLGIGIENIAIGVFAVICLYRLGKYMRSGPGSVKVLYGMSIAGTLILTMWLVSISPNVDLSMTGIADSFLPDILMLVVNSIYYSKHLDLFVN